MGLFSFRELQNGEQTRILPRLFDILYGNMSVLAPSGYSYEEDQNVWMSYIAPLLDQGAKRIVLMFWDDSVVGYSQYSMVGDTLHVDEVQVLPQYHRTMLFYRFCQYMIKTVPETVWCIESYVRKDNANSISIHEGLGMKRIGENKSGTSWLYCGDRENAEVRFLR